MDRQSLTQLQQTIAQSRDVIAQRSQRFREQINVKKHVHHSIQKKPWLWISSCTLLGFIAQSQFSRKTKQSPNSPNTPLPQPKKNSLIRTLLWSATTTLARPYLLNLTKKYLHRLQSQK